MNNEWRDLPTMEDVAAAQAVEEEMTTREQYEEWFIKTFDSRPFPPASAPAFDFCWAGYQAGAASRDAEVVSLTNQRDYEYVRAENAEQERDQFEQVRDQLRAQINLLISAIKVVEIDSEEVLDFDECTAMCVPMDAYHGLVEAAEATPEQSLAEYRNKVIEECAVIVENCEPDEHGRLSIQEIAEAVSAMKEQP